MDCTTFQNSEIDALYGELDAAGSAAMAEHAATCASCSARFERLRGTRGLVLSVAIEAVSDNFESRVMGAVDAALAKRTAGAPPAAAPPAKAEGGARIFQFMARPAFAAAAVVVLVLGGAAFMVTQTRAKSAAAPMSANAESSPAASTLTPVPMDDPAQAVAAATATAAAAPGTPPAEPSPMASAAGGAFALNDPSPPPPPAAVAMAAPAPAKIAASKPALSSADDRAFTAAKALYSSGRYAEALPRFEALKANNPEADLYAARCIAKTRGCAAAAPRYALAAQNNAGTEAGNRATLEGAKCYQASGELAEARKRYTVAKDEDSVSLEATEALDALDKKSAGTPGAGVHAAPKAMPAPAPASPSRK